MPCCVCAVFFHFETNMVIIESCWVEMELFLFSCYVATLDLFVVFLILSFIIARSSKGGSQCNCLLLLLPKLFTILALKYVVFPNTKLLIFFSSSQFKPLRDSLLYGRLLMSSQIISKCLRWKNTFVHLQCNRNGRSFKEARVYCATTSSSLKVMFKVRQS